MIVSKLPFMIFNPKVLHLSSSQEYGCPNLFPGKVDVEVSIRLDNSNIAKLSPFKKPLQDSRIKNFSLFSLVSLVSITKISFESKANPR